MATPQDVKKKIKEYVAGTATLDDVKTLMKGTKFTHQPLQVYGEDPYYDPDSWYVAKSVPGLSYEDRLELGKLVEYMGEH